MKIVGIKKEKVEKKDDLKTKLKELWHYLEGMEFAEERDEEEIYQLYAEKVIAALMDLKKNYGDKISKFM